jgi:dienelactone hydrolase
LVFVLNGNGFGAANPNGLTADADAVLRAAADQAIQIAYPSINSVGAFSELEKEIEDLSHKEPIGIVGFSAGGSLALRLAGDPALDVSAVLDYYGPPDLKDFLAYHQGDRDASYVLQHIDANPEVINLLSGPSKVAAHVVGAFGLKDHNVVASLNVNSLLTDFPRAHVYTYAGPHGVAITASPGALEDFLTHLG